MLQRFMIETPHDSAECLSLVTQVRAMGYLHHFEWGCKAGVHTGWAIIEAEDEKQARLAVPPLVSGKARVTRIQQFRPEDVEPLHPRQA
jgi:hypothetical protein